MGAVFPEATWVRDSAFDAFNKVGGEPTVINLPGPGDGTKKSFDASARIAVSVACFYSR